MALTLFGFQDRPHDIGVSKTCDAPGECVFLLDFSRPVEKIRWLGIRSRVFGPTVALPVPVVHLGEKAGTFVFGVSRGEPYFADLNGARMKQLTLRKIIERSVQIREKYHLLESKHHGSRWSIEEDALAFLSDAGLVGRLTMSQQGRWPSGDTDLSQLKHKLAESIWWLVVLSARMDIDIDEALESFLSTTNAKLPSAAA
jgi:NTP pyrophosphatase (non-canonical NTP hydrolase)